MEYNDMEDEEYEEYDPLKDTGSTAYWMNEWEKEKEENEEEEKSFLNLLTYM